MVRLVKVDRHLRHRRRDEEQVHLQLLGQQAGRPILVDDGPCTHQVACFILDDRDTPAPDSNDNEAALHQLADSVQLHDAQWNGRSNHPSPAPARILHHLPAVLLEQPCLLFSGETADALARTLKAGILAVDQHLGDHGSDRFVDAATLELIGQRLGDHIADRALGIGADHVQRGGVHLVGGQLIAAQDKANLGSVAMGDNQVPATLDHVGDMVAGFPHCLPLGFYIFVLFV